jgi:predicted flavoprotein YhiN
MIYDVVVIGGGPSGLMAAIAAGEKGLKVLLIDKGDKLGRKLAISGGGRCNVTNRLPVEEIIKHLPGNGKFLYSAFSIFSNEDIIKFFEKLGIELKGKTTDGCSLYLIKHNLSWMPY